MGHHPPSFRTSGVSEKPYPFTSLDILLPQTVHVPCVVFLPFFRVTDLGFRISRLALHFKQYPSIEASKDLVWRQFTTLLDEVTV